MVSKCSDGVGSGSEKVEMDKQYVMPKHLKPHTN